MTGVGTGLVVATTSFLLGEKPHRDSGSAMVGHELTLFHCNDLRHSVDALACRPSSPLAITHHSSITDLGSCVLLQYGHSHGATLCSAASRSLGRRRRFRLEQDCAGRSGEQLAVRWSKSV